MKTDKAIYNGDLHYVRNSENNQLKSGVPCMVTRFDNHSLHIREHQQLIHRVRQNSKSSKLRTFLEKVGLLKPKKSTEEVIDGVLAHIHEHIEMLKVEQL